MGDDSWNPVPTPGAHLVEEALVVRHSPDGDSETMGHDRPCPAGEDGGEGALIQCLWRRWITEHAAMNGDEKPSSKEMVDLPVGQPGFPGMLTGDE